jgi:hypothetical protein
VPAVSNQLSTGCVCQAAVRGGGRLSSRFAACSGGEQCVVVEMLLGLQ